jgi:hypothetical protein
MLLARGEGAMTDFTLQVVLIGGALLAFAVVGGLLKQRWWPSRHAGDPGGGGYDVATGSGYAPGGGHHGGDCHVGGDGGSCGDGGGGGH